MLAIALRSIGFLGKLLYEAIEEVEVGPVEAVRSTMGWVVPACIMTADYSDETAEQVQKAGCELLRKPVRPAELRALLAHMTG